MRYDSWIVSYGIDLFRQISNRMVLSPRVLVLLMIYEKSLEFIFLNLFYGYELTYGTI